MIRSFLLFCTLFFAIQCYPQCGDGLIDVCYPTIKQYKFLKSFPVRLKKGKKNKIPPQSRVSVALNGGVRYRITACDSKEYESKVIVNIFTDVNGRAQLIGSTYNPKINKHYPAIEFNCQKTGIYFFNFQFENGKEGCSVCLLSVEDW